MFQENATLKVQVIKNGKPIAEKSFESFPVIFGRSEDCHLCLKDFKYVSRSHGSISIENNSIMVTDLNSSNGIVFENKKIPRFVLSQSGGFQVEDLIFKLELISSQERTQVVNDEVTDLMGKAAVKISIPNSAPKSTPAITQNPITKNPEINTPWSLKEFEWKKLEFSLLPDPETRRLPLSDLVLQGTLMWENEIYDVRNFELNERIKLGPKSTEPLDVPVFKGELDLGKFTMSGANLIVPKNFTWKLFRESIEVPLQSLLQSRHIEDKGSFFSLFIALNEVIVIELGDRMQFRLRYVPIPRPLIRKTWIENRDEFKRAITISLIIHGILSVVAIFLAPAPHGPKVKDVPQRFAKLLVEPPKQTFAFEPPPPPPPPPPEPEVVEPPPPKEEPKPVAQKKPEPKKAIPKKVEKPKPVVKAQPLQTAPPKKVVQAPSPPSAEQEMANLFNSLPTPTSGQAAGLKNDNIQIKKGSGPPSKSGVKVSGLGAGTSTTATANSPIGLGLGSQAGQTGYAQTKNSKAGQRGVVGAVIGAPSFSGVAKDQGITTKEVMSVVNRHLPEIYRCYERALFNDPNIVGRVEYEWEINATGVVEEVSVKRSEVSNGDFLNSCVSGIFKKMKFPAAKNGQSTTANIGFPFGKN